MASALCDSALTSIGTFPWKSSRNLPTAAILALVLGLSGCGGDDDEASTTSSDAATAPTASTESTPVEEPAETTEPPEATETSVTPSPSPEDEEGGAGDEEPARTLALFTARDGRIIPRVVRVPAFISVRVELRSADGETYGLRFGGTTITVGDGLGSVSTTIDGLRQGESIVGRPTGAGNSVRVAATAEPGP